MTGVLNSSVDLWPRKTLVAPNPGHEKQVAGGVCFSHHY